MNAAPPSPVVPRAFGSGMVHIVRFNWPFYAVAIALVGVAVALTARGPASGATLAVAVIAAGAAWFVAASLVVSFWVYDGSDLYRWRWLERVALPRSGSFVQLQAGYDETSASLRVRFPDADWRLFDVFDSRRTIAPSLARARRSGPPPATTESVPAAMLPLPDESVDAVLSLLAVHEVRDEVERHALAREVRRVLRSDGAWIVAEHLRDVANLMAFGPGFFHFLPRRTWLETFDSAGLRVADEFRVTPFVTVFVVRR